VIDALSLGLASVHDAASVRVPPWLAVVCALAQARPDGIGATIEWLVAHRDELEAAYTRGCAGKLGLPALPEAMQFEPELGFLDRSRDDHALRDRYLFADVVGKQSFYQTAVYAISGIAISSRDADMLDELGQANLLVDRRAWPMAVTRRVAAHGGGYAAAVVAGTAMLAAPVLAGAAAADCARFLRHTRADGRPVSEIVAGVLARGERVMGFGRPLVGPDERVPIMEQVLRRYGRHDQPYVRLLRELEAELEAQKGLRSTSAAWAAAVLTDLGMSPGAVQAVSNYWVAVCVYAQALFSDERAPSL
jgi:hypothetical protein